MIKQVTQYIMFTAMWAVLLYYLLLIVMAI